MPLISIRKLLKGVKLLSLKFLRYSMLSSKFIAFNYLLDKQNFFRHGAKFATLKFATEFISMYIGRKKLKIYVTEV